MFKRLKITIFSILCAILSLSLVFTSVINVDAAKKVKMPTKMTDYEMNDEGNWVKRRYTTYTYNKKGDCTKTKRTFYYKDGTTDNATIKLKYTYKKGKKTKVVAIGPLEERTFTYDKKERISKIHSYVEESREEGDIDIFTYDSKGYVKSIKKTSDYFYYPYYEQIWTYNTIISGSTVTITFNGNDFFGDPEGPEVMTFKSSLLVKKQNTPNNYIEEYTYTKAKKGSTKGLITTKYCTRTYKDGSVKQYKTTYSYGKKKSTKTKYYKVINEDVRVVVSNLRYCLWYDYKNDYK